MASNVVEALVAVWKHLGPGPHPSGSNQDVHGSGGSTPESAVPLEGRIRKWNYRDSNRLMGLWAADGPDVAEHTDDGITRVHQLMQEDSRWGDALEQWDQLSPAADEAFGAVYNEAQRLKMEGYGLARAVGAGDLWDGASMEQAGWDLEVYVADNVVDVGDDAEDKIGGFSLEELAVGMVVHTTEEPTGLADDTWNPHPPNARWEILGIDDGLVTLRQLSTTLEDDPFGLGDPETLGVLLGGENEGMGPRIIEAEYETLFDVSDLDTDFPAYVALPRYDLDDIEGDVADFATAWDDFESTYGVNADIAEAYIDMGDYSVFEGSDFAAEVTANSPDSFVVDDSYGGGGTMVVESDLDVPMAMRNLWANTAVNEHKWAIAFQMAVRDEFGVNSVAIDDLVGRAAGAIEDANAVYERYDTALRVYARAVYNMTQEEIAKVDPFDDGMWPVVRGMKLYAPVLDEHYPDIRIGRSGLPLQYTPVEATLNPLSSWSVDPQVALKFTGFSTRGNWKAVTRAYIPTSQIWGISTRGNGSYREREVIVLGGDDSVVGEMAIQGKPR